jgi:hypothetical protein
MVGPGPIAPDDTRAGIAIAAELLRRVAMPRSDDQIPDDLAQLGNTLRQVAPALCTLLQSMAQIDRSTGTIVSSHRGPVRVPRDTAFQSDGWHGSCNDDEEASLMQRSSLQEQEVQVCKDKGEEFGLVKERGMCGGSQEIRREVSGSTTSTLNEIPRPLPRPLESAAQLEERFRAQLIELTTQVAGHTVQRGGQGNGETLTQAHIETFRAARALLAGRAGCDAGQTATATTAIQAQVAEEIEEGSPDQMQDDFDIP